MKKSLLIVLSMLLVMGFATTVFAVHAEIPAETQSVVAKGATQITLGGSIRFRGETKVNTGDFLDDRADNFSGYDGRVRLSVDAQVSPNTMGRIQLESGDADGNDVYTWGASGSDDAGTYAEGNGKRGDMRILEAWIQSKNLFGSPLGIKVGHMPYKLGEGLFANHSKYGDDLIMFFVEPTKEMHLALINVKFTEGTNTTTNGANTNNNSDDTDVYTLLGVHKIDPVNASWDISYIDDQNFSSRGFHLWNIGVRGSAKIANMVNVRADVEFQTGKAKGTQTALTSSQVGNTATEVKVRGYAFLIGADVALGQVTLDAAIGMGSGDNNASDNKVKTFQTAQSSGQKFTYVYDYRARTSGVNAPSTGASGLGAADTGIANTTYYKIGASAKPVKDLSAGLDLYLLKATKAVSTSSTYNDKDIGVEVDGRMKYNIDKNLVYFIEGGYLFAGDFYRNITANAVEPDNAYAVRHGIELTF